MQTEQLFRRSCDSVVDSESCHRLNTLESAVTTHIKEHTVFEKTLADNVKTTQQIAANTDEIVGMLKVLRDTRGFIATIKRTGVVVIWICAVGGAIGVILSFILAAIKHGLEFK